MLGCWCWLCRNITFTKYNLVKSEQFPPRGGDFLFYYTLIYGSVTTYPPGLTRNNYCENVFSSFNWSLKPSINLYSSLWFFLPLDWTNWRYLPLHLSIGFGKSLGIVFNLQAYFVHQVGKILFYMSDVQAYQLLTRTSETIF